MSGKRVVSVALNSKSIDAAIKELRKYQKWITTKSNEFVKELAQEGMTIASAKFSQAQYDGTNDVTVSVEERDNGTVAVVAVGTTTLFIEFGTGVKYPDDHPEAGNLGMVHGTYGHGLGRLEKGWRYDGDPGTNGEVISSGKHQGMVHTYGNPANMSMYLTVQELEHKLAEIARRVFV